MNTKHTDKSSGAGAHSPINLPAIRHTLAHALAAAVLEIYPDAKPSIGPAIDNGFYYDFEFSSPISDKELAHIERKMRTIVGDWRDFTHKEVTAADAKAHFKHNPYKLELIDEIASRIIDGQDTVGSHAERLTFYTAGVQSPHPFVDLCRGGHVENPSKDIAHDGWKLTHIAGAYWRGDEKNTMLTRIYGLAFESKAALDAYETMIEEAKKRDHKKLGKELKLFTISPLVGSGLPLMQPKGMIIRQEITEYLWNLHKKRGYQRVWTPHIAKEELYVTSGHAAKFGDELFRVTGGTEKFFLKPMNCPHHMQIFADNQFSYRDMPVRYFEPATIYRDEKSGQLAGLARVRSITQDDGHLFCRVSQLHEEASTIVHIIKDFYATFGMLNDYWVRLSVRGDDKSKYLGTDEVWNTAESALESVATSANLPYKLGPGEAAFYGPKLDFMFKDSIGREWQLATLQCDFNLPERFDLSFTNEKGEKERPVVIHRAISGSLERFLGILIEHYAGKFPLWISPVQVRIIPIGNPHHKEAALVRDLLADADIRVDVDMSDDNFGKKVRNAKTEHVPYTIIIGDKDLAQGKVTLESRDAGQIGQLTKEEALARLVEEIRLKK